MDDEFTLQSYVSTQLKRRGILHHGDQNAGKRGPRAAAQMKASGACKGWPDMCIVHGSSVYWLEFKAWGGRVSKEQREVHGRLEEQEQFVGLVQAKTKEDAWKIVMDILGL